MDRPIAGTEGQSFDGGCHCGAIRFRAGGPLREVFLCHCSDCLKLSGTSWGASAAYKDHFHYLTEARPRWYRSSQGAERGFCADCGAQMFYRRDGRDMISIAPGAFDEGEMLYVGGQIFRHSHPAWGPVAPADILDLDTPDHANRGQRKMPDDR
ncbi:MAG: GFA family protein [Alphaproteobacteria bacterium]|nr:GFA family protein [Alphaproteobacteria bacterium]